MEKEKTSLGDEGLYKDMHEKFMQEAIKEAQAAARMGEVPVGAVVVRDGQIVGRGRNMRESTGDPTAHGEIIALRDTARKLGGWYLHDCVMYCTLEPCPMCAGALMQARLEGVYFGASDPKAGCCGSVCSLPDDRRFPHRLFVRGGLLADECAAILRGFFEARRKKDSNSDLF